MSTEIFVSRDGNDSAPGTRSRPFATIARAQDAARAALPTAPGDVVVNIAGGTYRLLKPLTLTPADSGRPGHRIVYQPLGYEAPQETGERPRYDKVVISGGRRVSNWTLFDRRLNIWKADVGSLESRQLYVAGQRAPRAEIPNTLATIETPLGLTITDQSLAVASWKSPADIEAVWIRNGVEWSAPRCGVASIAFQQIVFDQPCFSRFIGSTDAGANPTRKPTSWENSLSFLTKRGTHVLDTSRSGHHILYYIPRRGEDMRQVRAIMPVLQTLVQAHGTQADPVQHVTFRGLTFTYATWNYPSSTEGFVHHLSEQYWSGDPTVYPQGETSHVPGSLRFYYVDHIRLVRNVFQHLGAEALEFDGAKHNAIVGNVITDTSSGGILLGNVQPDTRASISNDNRITNNWIHDIGQEYYGGTGITAIQPNKILIAHNQINGLPDRGIFVCGITPTCQGPGTTGARVLNNKVFNVMRVMGDGGGLYIVGPQGSSYESGAVMQGNVIHDTDYEPQIYQGVLNSTPLDIAMYPDFGATWQTFSRNVVYNTSHSAGGLSLPVAAQSDHLRFLNNFWVDKHPWWPNATPTNVTESGNTVLPRSTAAAACMAIPACKKIVENAGLSPKFRYLLANSR